MLDQQSKEKFEAAYQKDKARYEEEMKNYQPSQHFLEMKAEWMEKQAAKLTETGMENYFTFLLSSWRKVSGENSNLGAKEVQWSRGEVGIKKEKKTKKVVDPEAPKKPFTARGSKSVIRTRAYLFPSTLPLLGRHPRHRTSYTRSTSSLRPGLAPSS